MIFVFYTDERFAHLFPTHGPRVSAVEIHKDMLQGETLYGLRVFTGRHVRPRSVKELLSRRP